MSTPLCSPVRRALLLVVAASATALLSACVPIASSTLRPVIRPFGGYSSVAHIVHHRYVRPFELDGRGLEVLPLPAAYHPVRAIQVVEREAWATSLLYGSPSSFALGVVTVTREARGVPAVRHLIAWVGLVREAGLLSCPMESATPRRRALPSSGWDAVVIGDALRTPAVYYQSAGDPCGPVWPTVVQRATEVLSVPWFIARGSTESRMPACSRIYESSSGSSDRFQLLVQVPEGDSMTSSAVANPPRCAEHVVDLTENQMTAAALPQTGHAPIGLVRQANLSHSIDARP